MTEQLLYTLDVTDASLADTVSCSIASTNPSTTNFFSRINAGSTGIYVIFFFFIILYNQYATAENRLSFFLYAGKVHEEFIYMWISDPTFFNRNIV